ncbi:MAG: Regulator of polyketide synthase expression [uncultured Frankineae bacterium]|uniref:Regulator of polyketide synthase expression n=1 Tax=uncultured Frankineae bacterium TaxID=437475 RepID=A0A6J4MQF0_9ACTN|nr:MAG: Regulator of polyketide synthase expression [uncultured Frankineae bacterium]
MAQATWQRVRRASSPLSTSAVRAMEELPWFAALPAEERSYVGLVLHTGLDAFAQWLREPAQPPPVGPELFAAAPKELTRVVTLKQTVQLIRVAVEVVERAVPRLAAPGDEPALREAVLRYSREIAFAAADVYAAAAEARGAWDARVEAGVVDALVRGHAGELTLSRASALGWNRVDWVVALAAPAPEQVDAGALRAAARYRGLSLLTGEAAPALVLVLGGTGDTAQAVAHLVAALPPGPVVVGPVVAELAMAAPSVQEALAGLAAVAAWPEAPRPVEARELLAERAVLGELAARRRLLEEVYRPLAAAGGDLLATAAAYLEGGGSVEGTGRALFLHPNTVRYRLKKLSDVIGYDLTSPREALVVRLALLLGRTSTT